MEDRKLNEDNIREVDQKGGVSGRLWGLMGESKKVERDGESTNK